MTTSFRIILGALIIVILFTIFGGDDGIQFLIASIICTAGISLVLYLPAAYILGTIVHWIYRLAKGESLVEKKDKQMPIYMMNNLKALAGYVSQASKAGMPGSEIRRTLREVGWREELIDDAFSESVRK